MLDKLTITVSKTSTGHGVYIQIMSGAGVPVNIVLIANEVKIEDRRN